MDEERSDMGEGVLSRWGLELARWWLEWGEIGEEQASGPLRERAVCSELLGLS